MKVGSTVRSYDFPGLFAGQQILPERKDCYVEGVLEKIAAWEPCPCGGDHYHIRVTKRVWDGEEMAPEAPYVFPSVHDSKVEEVL